MENKLKAIHDALMEGEAQVVKELTEEALKEGLSAKVILQEGLIDGMQAVGVKFKSSEVWIPDVLMASRAMHAGLYVLKPILAKEPLYTIGKIVIGTVAGDLHDIGKNMVIMMLQGSGVEVIDIGIDNPASSFVEAVKKHNPQVVGISALLTTTMPEVPVVIEELKKEGLRKNLKIIIGGGPVTNEFAQAVGADSYAVDALAAVDEVLKLLEETKNGNQN